MTPVQLNGFWQDLGTSLTDGGGGMNEKKRVLLVDDEAAVTRTLQLYLEATGQYEVRSENQSLEAMRTARLFQPHIVLLDVSMPDMDGGEIAALIQKDQALVGVPIVFLTGLIRREELNVIGKEIAGRPYLAKPPDPQLIAEVIEEYTT